MANSTAFTSGRDLASVSENVELLTGQRGNKLDKAVTYRDLESLGVATLSRIGSSYSAKANPVLTTTASVVDTPTKPKNVQANGAFNTVLIDWDEPDYRGHAYTEVWRADSDNLSIAVRIGTTNARMYSDPIGGDAKVYYWVRFVNDNNVVGPYNSSAGTYAETAVDVQQLLDSLQGMIEESQLSQALRDNIGLIPSINTSIQQIPSINTAIQQITVDLSSLDDRQAQAEEILKAAQDLLGSTTIDVALLHDQLSQQVQKYGADVQNMISAVLSVNAETGEITLDAINLVKSDLETSITEVSQRVSAVEGTLTQKASLVEVAQQGSRISTVETQLDAINVELTNKVTRAELTETTSDVTQLTTRMSAAEGAITSKAEQQTVTNLDTRVASAEQSLIAVNDDLESKAVLISGIQSSYESLADEVAGNATTNEAAITSLNQTVTDNQSATSQRLDNLDTSVSGMNSAITSLQQASSNATEATAYNYSQLKSQTDLIAIAAANDALSSDDSNRVHRTSDALIRSDLTTLTNDHESLAQSVEVLQANFETETSFLSAQIANEQTARTTGDSALAQSISTLEANYKSADGTLSASIATEITARAGADSALTQRIDTLTSTVNTNKSSIEAAIQTEQTTRATADTALSQSIIQLQASVSSNAAAIQSESTARANADSALSTRIDTVQATANNLTASVQTQSSAISTLQSGAQAMWTTKTQVGDITTGIGLMTGSDGKSQVMISASQLFMFDPNGAAPTRSIFAVSNGQVVIQKAVIEAATIETVTAMSITADYVRAGVSITSPSIVSGTMSLGSGDNSMFLADGAIGIGKGGPYGGWGWGWHTIIYADGGLFTDRLHASSGDFTGYVRATSGYMTNVTIGEDCNVLGTVYANKIIGDVVAIKNFAAISGVAPRGSWVTLTSFNIAGSSKQRVMMVSGSSANMSIGTSGTFYIQLLINGAVVNSKSVISGDLDSIYDIPAGGNVNIIFRVYMDSQYNNYSYSGGLGMVTIAPISSGTFI